MALIFLTILLGLHCVGCVCAEERKKNLTEELRRFLDGPDGRENAAILYELFVNETRKITESQRRVSPFGQNDFEVEPYETPSHNGLGWPDGLVKRIKRGFVAPECDKNDYIHDDEYNEFERATTPFSWLQSFKNAWNVVLDLPLWNARSLARHNASKELHVLEATPFPPEKCFDSTGVETLNKVANLIPHSKAKGSQSKTTMVRRKSQDFFETYKSRRQSGCGCEINTKGAGCTCCYLWKENDILFCAGAGYKVSKKILLVRVTVQNFKIFEFKKKIDSKALKKAFKFLRKVLCVPHKFSLAVTGCVELELGFKLDFNPFPTRPRIELCANIVTRILYAYYLYVMDLPCWELAIPGFGGRDLEELTDSDLGNARLTWENGTSTIRDPLKLLYSVENIEGVQEFIKTLQIEHRNYTKTFRANLPKHVTTKDGHLMPAVVYRASNMESRVLEVGSPTKPVNWEPADESKLHYMVVLYTEPLASPIKLDEDDADVEVIPRFREMAADAYDHAEDDDDIPEILKVHAALGKACGGVLLTADKVLTICACIRFFYMYRKYEKKVPPLKDSRFDLLSANIYVTYADRRFTADQAIFELDYNPDKFMNKSECFEAIESGADVNVIQMHMVVMPISPELEKFETLNLVPWLDTVRQPTLANMTIIGMEARLGQAIFNASGYEFITQYEMVKVPFKSCKKTSYCLKGLSNTTQHISKIPKEFLQKTQCFCALDDKFQLCDGVVGFPVISTAGLVGLSSIPMSCREEGSMVVSVLSDERICEINQYLQPDVQNPRPCNSGPTPTITHPTQPRSTPLNEATVHSATIVTTVVILIYMIIKRITE